MLAELNFIIIILFFNLRTKDFKNLVFAKKQTNKKRIGPVDSED